MAFEQKYAESTTRMTRPPEIAERVVEDLETFVLRHSQNRRPYIARNLIEHHFGVHRQKAHRVKQLVESHVTEDELEDAAP